VNSHIYKFSFLNDNYNFL